MAVGAFAPWVTALHIISLNGWDIERHRAEMLLAIAVLGAVTTFALRATSGGSWATLMGGLGVLLTLYEHHSITSTIAGLTPQYPTISTSLVHVGWGLDAAVVASISLTLSGITSFFVAPALQQATVSSVRYEPNVPTVPAGWYNDPNDNAMLRYWNGFGWTTQTAKPAS